MVQTRNQKKIVESKEKMAVETLLSLSEMDICEPEPENIVFNEPYKWTNDEMNSARIEMAREYCKNEMIRVDKPMHDFVKYCPYNGSIDEQIKQSIKNNNMEVYWALKKYKENMQIYTETENYLKNNFNKIMENFNDDYVINYLNRKSISDLHKKKHELSLLKDIKRIKDIIDVKNETFKIISDDIKCLQREYEKKIEEYKQFTSS